MSAPNAELAYKVLDHIDAHPKQWKQCYWVTDCGTSFCFAGWALELTGHVFRDYLDEYGLRRMQLDGNPEAYADEVARAASRELRIKSWFADELFENDHTREDLGRLVTEIFGPRPGGEPS